MEIKNLEHPSTRAFLLRLAYLLAIMGVFVARIPDALLRPQFWAEDGKVFFHDAYCLGTAAVFKPYNGYHNLVQRMTALAAGSFAPLHAPALYLTVAIALTALVLWLILSPRLPLPFKPFLALMVVLSPHGSEVYATLTNINWLLPLGALAIVMMPPDSRTAILAGELLYLLLACLSGPVVLLLLPAVLFQLWRSWPEPSSRNRLLLIIAVMVLAASVQASALLSSGKMAVSSPTVSGLQLLYLRLSVVSVHIPGSFAMGVSNFFPALAGYFSGNSLSFYAIFFLTSALIYFIVILMVSRHKKELLVFGYGIVVIVAVSLVRAGADINSWLNYFNIERYFFIPLVLCSWVLIISLTDKYLRFSSALLLLLLLISTQSVFRREPRADLNWPYFAANIGTTQVQRIPINPPGWFIEMDCRGR